MIMAKNNAIYAPGELSRVRDKLGVTNDSEAKRMAQLLGGEVGTERSTERSAEPEKKNPPISDKGGRRIHKIEMVTDEDLLGKSKSKQKDPFPGDDPMVPMRLNYSERVKIDRYAGQFAFEIKSSIQVLISIFSFFKEPADLVNPRFVVARMNENYSKIEKMVTATRSIFPKGNTKRNKQLKRASPFVYKILDIIRSWDIEALSKNIAELQAHPRTVRVSDFSDILRVIYRPLFLIEDINMENIKAAFKLIYRILYIESPMEAKERYQEVIRNIITSLIDIRKNVHFGLYPLLMKLISDRFISYQRFFIERRRRFMAFINAAESDRLNSSDFNIQQIDSIDVEAMDTSAENEESEENDEITEESLEIDGEVKKEDESSDPKTTEQKAKEETVNSETRTLDQARSALSVLFPKAGWEKLDEFPDLYPYFGFIYNLKQGYELIAPCDPIQQIAVLMNILDDLFIGMRYMHFGMIAASDGSPVKVNDEIGDTLNNWRSYIEDSFSRDFLPRLTEYCRLLENTRDTRSPYAKKCLNELHWIKRLYFLPYYKFESLGPPPFHKNEITPVYTEIRRLRKTLTSVVMGIEQGIHAGGAAARAPCSGINNPWAAYNFQVPNPISRRLDMMLPQERKINATVIIFSLSAVTLLDYIINNENSWAYGNRPGPIFRSNNDDGITPVFGIEARMDVDKIFKESLKKNAAAAAENKS